MCTVLSNTRNANLYLIVVLAAMIVAALTLVRVPAVSTPQPAFASVSSPSQARSDYYERHPELRVSGATMIDTNGDFALRHPGWVIPATSVSEVNDYFQRHPELGTSDTTIDLSDYFQRH